MLRFMAAVNITLNKFPEGRTFKLHIVDVTVTNNTYGINAAGLNIIQVFYPLTMSILLVRYNSSYNAVLGDNDQSYNGISYYDLCL